MNYRDKTLIIGESLLIKVALLTENKNSAILEPYDKDELNAILNNEVGSDNYPQMIAEARLSDGKVIPLTIIQDVDGEGNPQTDGELTLYSDVNTWDFPGESFDVNIALKDVNNTDYKNIDGTPKELVLYSATFNETFYITRSASDLSERGILNA